MVSITVDRFDRSYPNTVFDDQTARSGLRTESRRLKEHKLMSDHDITALLADKDTAARLLRAVADHFTTAGDRVGAANYSRAAGFITANNARIGRAECDDTGALERMRDLIDSRVAYSVRHAATLVSRTMRGQQSVDSAMQRLARKYRAEVLSKHKNIAAIPLAA
jgi:hypothetical protein